MCFSPLASFTTAAVTGAIGLAALGRASHPREYPLAATPLLFAVQQLVEGLLWLNLPYGSGSEAAAALSLTYLVFALAFWPVFTPVAAWLVEPDRARRRLMAPCLVLGAALSAYLSYRLLSGPHAAIIHGGHIIYATRLGDGLAVGLAYVAAVSMALMLSSLRTVAALGGLVMVGSAVAYFAYWEAFLSVWCLFAGAASVVILWHFERARRARPAVAA